MLLDYTAKPTEPEFQFKKREIYWECNCLTELNNSFVVSIVKEDGGYIVFSEEHEPEEISKIYTCGKYFKLLRDATKVAAELCQDMYNCTFTEMYAND